MAQAEFESRRHKALAAIRHGFGTLAGEGDVNLFGEHRLDEMPSAYWQERSGSEKPGPQGVPGRLECKSAWGVGDLEVLDFTLPGDVSNDVVTVRFGATGAVAGLAMER